MEMNRRGLIKSLALLPVVGMVKVQAAEEWPRIVGVKETPWLCRKVRVTCDGAEVMRCIRCSVQEGWCEVFVDDRANRSIIRGDVRIEWKDEA